MPAKASKRHISLESSFQRPSKWLGLMCLQCQVILRGDISSAWRNHMPKVTATGIVKRNVSLNLEMTRYYWYMDFTYQNDASSRWRCRCVQTHSAEEISRGLSVDEVGRKRTPFRHRQATRHRLFSHRTRKIVACFQAHWSAGRGSPSQKYMCHVLEDSPTKAPKQ
jgi:hypothetical protein